jgi:hypothetical protein
MYIILKAHILKTQFLLIVMLTWFLDKIVVVIEDTERA